MNISSKQDTESEFKWLLVMVTLAMRGSARLYFHSQSSLQLIDIESMNKDIGIIKSKTREYIDKLSPSRVSVQRSSPKSRKVEFKKGEFVVINGQVGNP